MAKTTSAPAEHLRTGKPFDADTTEQVGNIAGKPFEADIIKQANAIAESAGIPKSGSNPAGVLKRSSSYYLDPKAISRKPGFNPRFDFGEIDMLAKSIRANGLLQPLRVRRTEPGKFELIDGDRRLTAIESILKQDSDFFATGVHSIVVEASTTDLDALFQMFESNSGKPFEPLEEAAAYKRMHDAGLSVKKICERAGRAAPHVIALLALLETDQSVQDAVKDGSLNKSLAKQIAVVTKGDKEKQKELVADAKAAGKDKKARRAVAAKVTKAHADRAKKAGRVLKIRALTDDQLSAIGAKIGEVLAAQMIALGLPAESDMTSWVSGSDADLKAAFTFGVLQGLKAAAGVDVKLVLSNEVAS